MEPVDGVEMSVVDEAIEVHERAPVLRIVEVAVDRRDAAGVLGVPEATGLAPDRLRNGQPQRGLVGIGDRGDVCPVGRGAGAGGAGGIRDGPGVVETALALPDGSSLPNWYAATSASAITATIPRPASATSQRGASESPPDLRPPPPSPPEPWLTRAAVPASMSTGRVDRLPPPLGTGAGSAR